MARPSVFKTRTSGIARWWRWRLFATVLRMTDTTTPPPPEPLDQPDPPHGQPIGFDADFAPTEPATAFVVLDFELEG